MTCIKIHQPRCASSNWLHQIVFVVRLIIPQFLPKTDNNIGSNTFKPSNCSWICRLKYWTHWNVNGSCPICRRDLFLSSGYTRPYLQKLSRFSFVFFGGSIKLLVPGNPLKLAWVLLGSQDLPSPQWKQKRTGRAWYRFACNIAAQRHHSNNYKSCDAFMQPRDWLTQTATLLLLKQVSCDCVGETSAWLKQQWRRRRTQYVGKILPIYYYHKKLLQGYEERL